MIEGVIDQGKKKGVVRDTKDADVTKDQGRHVEVDEKMHLENDIVVPKSYEYCIVKEYGTEEKLNKKVVVFVLNYIANLEKGITSEQLELLLLSPTTRKKFARLINITVDDYDNVIVDVCRSSERSFDIERKMEFSFPLTV